MTLVLNQPTLTGHYFPFVLFHREFAAPNIKQTLQTVLLLQSTFLLGSPKLALLALRNFFLIDVDFYYSLGGTGWRC